MLFPFICIPLPFSVADAKKQGPTLQEKNNRLLDKTEKQAPKKNVSPKRPLNKFRVGQRRKVRRMTNCSLHWLLNNGHRATKGTQLQCPVLQVNSEGN